MSVYDALINVPGSYRCPKCAFVQGFRVMYAGDGSVAVNLTPDPERLVCPNDGEPLKPETWQQRATEAETEWGKALEREAALRAALEAVLPRLGISTSYLIVGPLYDQAQAALRGK